MDIRFASFRSVARYAIMPAISAFATALAFLVIGVPLLRDAERQAAAARAQIAKMKADNELFVLSRTGTFEFQTPSLWSGPALQLGCHIDALVIVRGADGKTWGEVVESDLLVLHHEMRYPSDLITMWLTPRIAEKLGEAQRRGRLHFCLTRSHLNAASDKVGQ